MFWVLFLVLSGILFLTACLGMMMNRRNLLVLLLCVEMVFLSANMNFVLFSRLHADIHGQVMALFVLAVAAAESAIALALLVLMYRQYNSVDAKMLTNIRG